MLAFADTLDAQSFHLVGHDWGGFLAWKLAAEHPHRIQSVSVLSTPHIDAFLEAVAADPDQKARSQYIDFFKIPDYVAESFFLQDDAARLRSVYGGRVPQLQVSSNVRRLFDPGALTSVLNWYRALDMNARVGMIRVPTLYVWGDRDHAVGKKAATETARYVDAPNHFEVLQGHSHWLLDDAPDKVSGLICTISKPWDREPAGRELLWPIRSSQ